MPSKTSHSRYSLYLTRARSFYHRKEVKLYSNLILTFLAICAFAIFAIRPTAKTIAELIKELKDQKEVAARLTLKIDHLNQAEKNYQEVESELNLLDEALPTIPGTEILLAQLEKLALKNNCYLVTAKTRQVLLKGNIEGETEKT
ncbi:hypothetical protein MUP65_00120, partial [Patescibacteria group bacterium]|nr:hypothetical protein [Patescibacteria group bacterium]